MYVETSPQEEPMTKHQGHGSWPILSRIQNSFQQQNLWRDKISPAVFLFALFFIACKSQNANPGPSTDSGLPDLQASDTLPMEKDSSDQGNCPKGKTVYGANCLPILEDCGERKVPIPGGGCKTIGVEMCPGGLRSSADNTCIAIGPHPDGCPAGWTKNQKSFCEPILPSEACPPGSREVIGKSECQPLGACGDAPYGTIQPSAQTIYVNSANPPSDPDGSKEKPFASISAAIQKAPVQGQIVVAAGEYHEALSIDKPLSIQGRCAEKVSILGATNETSPAVTIKAKGVLLKGVTIVSPNQGVLLEVGDATLEDVLIKNCGKVGVVANSLTQLTLRNALLEKNVQQGLRLIGAKAVVERTVIRDSQPDPATLSVGNAITAVSSTEQSSQLSLKNSVISNNHAYGIAVGGSIANIEGTIIQGTKPQQSNNQGGYGVLALYSQKPAEVAMRDCLLIHNTEFAADSRGSIISLEHCALIDTYPQAASNEYGLALHAVVWQNTPAELSVKNSLIAQSRHVGIAVLGSKATLEKSIVRDTYPRASDMNYGYGVWVSPWSKVSSEFKMTSSLVANNHGFGLFIEGSAANISTSMIRDSQPLASSFKFGRGLEAIQLEGVASELKMDQSTVMNNRDVGIAISGAKATITNTIVQNTLPSVKSMAYGTGIQELVENELPSTLVLKDSLITQSHAYGLSIWGSAAELERTVIHDTRVQEADNLYGIGIHASYWRNTPATLSMKECTVAKNYGIGINLIAANATIDRSVVKEVHALAGEDAKDQPIEKIYGDGIVAQSINGLEEPVTVKISDSVIQDYARAGLIFYSSKGVGTVERSAFLHGIFPLALEKSPQVTLGQDNYYADNIENKVVSDRNLEVSPPPKEPPPP